MVMDLTIPMGITPQDLLTGVDPNHHLIGKEIIPIDTKIIVPGVQEAMGRCIVIGVLEGVKVLLLSMNSTK